YPSFSFSPERRVHPVVHVASQPGPLYVSPYSPSVDHPASSNDDDRTLAPMSPRDPAPPAFKRPRFDNPLVSSLPRYLDMTPEQIHRLLHNGRPNHSPFAYTANQLNEIAFDVFTEIVDYFHMYSPSSDQEAAARVHLITRVQDHFNVFLKTDNA
ncbi:hypothetical protein VP01_10649g1, partial [Puccinia sorghi]